MKTSPIQCATGKLGESKGFLAYTMNAEEGMNDGPSHFFPTHTGSSLDIQ